MSSDISELTTQSLQINNFNELSQVLVNSIMTTISTTWEQFNSEVESRQGAISDLVVHPNAAISASLITLIDSWRRSTHLMDLAQSTLDVDYTLLEYTAGNYRIARKPGRYASGQIMVVVSEYMPFSIQQGSQFEVEGVTFTVPLNYSARLTTASQTESTDRPLMPIINTDGTTTYGVVIDAVSSSMTAAGNIEKGTRLNPLFFIPNFIESYSYSSFNNGADPESNEELAYRAVNGITMPQLSSRRGMSAALKETFPTIVDDSVVGIGDVEMLRDRSLMYPISMGGRADWYVKTSTDIIEQVISKEAVLQEVVNDQSTWLMTFGRDEYSGLYSVSDIIDPVTRQRMDIISVTRGKDISRDAKHLFVPDIPDETSAAFTAYQVVYALFRDSFTPVDGLVPHTSKKDYQATVEYVDLIDEIQSFVVSDTLRPIGYDILVKAPVPCRVNVNVTLAIPINAVVDIPSIKQAISSYINSLKFVGYISGSAVTSLIHRMLPPNSYIVSFLMSGVTQMPSGESITTTASDHLEVNAPPYATEKTVCFYTNINRIVIGQREIM